MPKKEKKEKKDFLSIIQKQRAISKKEKFKGTFLNYLEIVKENPDTACLAHKRLCNVIEKHGISEMDNADVRKHKLFDGDSIKI